MNVMSGNRRAWVMLADAGCGRLLNCSSAPLDRCHVEEMDWIENTWEGHEHGRPSPRAGKDGHAYASQDHDNDEDLDRFARELAPWLERQVVDHGFDRLTFFAQPRLLGAFRKERSALLGNCLEDRHGDLVGLDMKQLANHPSIRELVGLTTTTSTAVR